MAVAGCRFEWQWHLRAAGAGSSLLAPLHVQAHTCSVSASHGSGPQVTPLYIPHQMLPFPEGLNPSKSDRSQSRLYWDAPGWASVGVHAHSVTGTCVLRCHAGLATGPTCESGFDICELGSQGGPERWQPVCQVSVSSVTGQLHSFCQYMGVALSLSYRHEAAVFLLTPAMSVPHGLYQS